MAIIPKKQPQEIYTGLPLYPGISRNDPRNRLDVTQVGDSKLATLYGPNNQTKVVIVGQAAAAALQSRGWTLKPHSKKIIPKPAPDSVDYTNYRDPSLRGKK